MSNNKASFGVKKWGGYAACYDALNSLSPYRKLQNEAAEALGRNEGEKILDAACGTGNLAELLLNRSESEGIEITAIDFSREMLEGAKKKCRDGRARFIRADLSRTLPFKDESFEKIASVNTLYAVSNPGILLAEFHRVMKKGGLLVVATPKRGYQNGLILKEHCESAKPDEYWLNAHSSKERERLLISEAIKDKRLAEQMAAVAEYNREISRNAKFHFFKADDLARLIEKCGFRVIKIRMVYARQGILVSAKKEE